MQQLLAAKAASGKTFTQIAAEAGLTNAYTAQLFFNQVGGRQVAGWVWGPHLVKGRVRY